MPDLHHDADHVQRCRDVLALLRGPRDTAAERYRVWRVVLEAPRLMRISDDEWEQYMQRWCAELLEAYIAVVDKPRVRALTNNSEGHAPPNAKMAAVVAQPVDTSGPLYTLEEVEARRAASLRELRRLGEEVGELPTTALAWDEAPKKDGDAEE